MTTKELCEKYNLSTSVIERLRTKVIRGEISEQDFILELEKKSESKKEKEQKRILDSNGNPVKWSELAKEIGVTVQTLKSNYNKAEGTTFEEKLENAKAQIEQNRKLMERQKKDKSDRLEPIKNQEINEKLTALADELFIGIETVRRYFLDTDKNLSLEKRIDIVREMVNRDNIKPVFSRIAQKFNTSHTHVRDIYERLPESSREEKIDVVIEFLEREANEKKTYTLSNGLIINFNKQAKAIGVGGGTLKKFFNQSTKDTADEKLQDAIEQCRKIDEKRLKAEDGTTIFLEPIAKAEGVSVTSLRNGFLKSKGRTNDEKLKDAIDYARKIKSKQYLDENDERIPVKKISKDLGIPYSRFIEAFKRFRANGSFTTEEIIDQVKKEYEEYQSSFVKYENGQTVNYAELGRRFGISDGVAKSMFLRAKGKNADEKVESMKREIEERSSAPIFSKLAKQFNISEATVARTWKSTSGTYEEKLEAVKETAENIHMTNERLTLENGKKIVIREEAKKLGISTTTFSSTFNSLTEGTADERLEKTKLIIKARKNSQVKINNISTHDLAIILGIKHSKLMFYINQGMKIDEIRKLCENEPQKRKSLGKKEGSLMYDDTTTLIKYCLNNKLNYSVVYRLVKDYNLSPQDAINTYVRDGQQISPKYIYERYGVLLKHLMLKYSVDYSKIVKDMQTNVVGIEDAIRNYIVTAESKQEHLPSEWLCELYSLLMDSEIPKEDYESGKEVFLVSQKEEQCMKRSKVRIDTIKRQMLLFDIADALQSGTFNKNEERTIIRDWYNLTPEEIETIYLDLYGDFKSKVLLAPMEKEKIEREKRRSLILNWGSLTKEQQDCMKREYSSSEIDEIRYVANQIKEKKQMLESNIDFDDN